MGYTHYYRQKREMEPEEFECFKADVAKLIAKLPMGIDEFNHRYANPGEEIGSGMELAQGAALMVAHDSPERVIITADAVHFNGSGFKDADCESFRIERLIDKSGYNYDKEAGEAFNFTKTRNLPYDAMVCAALLCLKSRAPTAWGISSDGEVSEWAAACRFAQEALGRKLPLGKIASFGKDKQKLSAAQGPTAVQVEIKEIEKASIKTKRSKPSGTL